MGVRGRGPDSTPLVLSRPTLVRTQTGVLDEVVEITGLGAQVCARRTDGDVLCWGNVAAENIRDDVQGTPYATLVFSGATAIAVGYKVACAITGASGVLECQGTRPTNWNDVLIANWAVTGAAKLALNGGGGYALMPDKTVLSFGVAKRGMRGNADASNSPASPVTDLTDVVAIAGNVVKVNS